MLPALILSALIPTADACKPPGPRDRRPCGSRDGHCFDLAINRQQVVPLVDAALRASLEDAVRSTVCWRITEPVQSALQPQVVSNDFTAEHLGALYDELEIVVTGLEGQQIPTRKGIRTDPTVRIGGIPMQTTVDIIDLDALPAGGYIATFRVRGPEGWDRKAVFLEMAPATGEDP